MAYPTPFHSGSPHGSASRCSQASSSSQAPGSGQVSGGGRPVCPPSSGEGEHQLEKLEFALAVALTRGDLQRSQNLRDQIAALGGNLEEPGT